MGDTHFRAPLPFFLLRLKLNFWRTGWLRKIHRLLVCIAVLATAACASNAPLQLEGVAKTGKQYTTTLKKVNELALNHSLEFTADLLPDLPRTENTLQQQNEALQERARLLAQIEEFFDTQAMYFSELEALAKGDHSTGTQRALKKLVEALNKAPDVGGIPRVTKEAVAGLAGHVSNWKHSATVKEVLLRDAETVGQALLTNQRILEEQIHWIAQREVLARQVEYREKVFKPYVGDKKLTETWKKAWIASIKQAPTIELLEQAKSESIEMQRMWLDVLRGQGNFEDQQP